MITKINKFKNFGIFSEFSWNPSINSFKEKNLIYGWNYSGKTTFSKLFSNFEARKLVHFPNSEYTVEIADGRVISHKQIETFPYLVKVFNSFYIKNVFSWDKDNNEGFEPILFHLGDQANIIQPKIDFLNNRRKHNLRLIIEKNEKIIFEFNEYSKEGGKFSKQATVIRKYLNDTLKSNEFNKGHFIDIVKQLKNAPEEFVLKKLDEKNIKEQALSTNDLSLIIPIKVFEEGATLIGNKILSLLKDSASNSIRLPELDSNPEEFKWVQQGLALHQDATTCKFCLGTFDDTRKKALDTYYSDKLKEIQDCIDNISIEINAERIKYELSLPHEKEIAKHLRDTFSRSLLIWEQEKVKYFEALSVYQHDLNRKAKSIFTAINTSEVTIPPIVDALNSINACIDAHNEFVQDFMVRTKSAQEIILRHYVAEYLISEKFKDAELNCINANKTINKCKSVIYNIEREIEVLNTHLKNTIRGKVELNSYMSIFLNRQDIKIDIKKEKYVLKRGEHDATNLSEGEKTAIAFSYFLTELRSLKEENKLKDTIVFFDDPISSLDSNHIFQIRSLIQHFFTQNEFLQLFISTHNFEFFSVMLDSKLFSNTNKNDTAITKCPYYLINRNSPNSSIIKNLPKSLRSHKSEYAYIFSMLKEYNEMQDKDECEYKILLPNALRRFMELYTLLRFPKGYTEVDERIKAIFSPDDGVFHNTKLYHWFSHQNQLEKVSHHDSKLILIDEAITEILEYIQKEDVLHWKGLTSA